jgi:nucleoside diphosphate kinase
VDFADNFTRHELGLVSERSVLLLSSNKLNWNNNNNNVSVLGHVISNAEAECLTLDQVLPYDMTLTRPPSLNGRDGISFSGPGPGQGIAVVFRGADCVKRLHTKFGSSDDVDLVPQTPEEADSLLKNLSTSRSPHTTYPAPASSNSTTTTCCVIKPHALAARQVGAILQLIEKDGFAFTFSHKLKCFDLDVATASEFLEVYKGGAVEGFNDMVNEFSSGTCLAIEIGHHTQQNNDLMSMSMSMSNNISSVVQHFRKTCGPYDISLATKLYPNSIRARFGVSNVQNAVHCTDLEEDGVLENEYFFEILADN